MRVIMCDFHNHDNENAESCKLESKDCYANHQWNVFSESMPIPLSLDFKLAFLKDLNGKNVLRFSKIFMSVYIL